MLQFVNKKVTINEYFATLSYASTENNSLIVSFQVVHVLHSAAKITRYSFIQYKITKYLKIPLDESAFLRLFRPLAWIKHSLNA